MKNKLMLGFCKLKCVCVCVCVGGGVCSSEVWLRVGGSAEG